MLGRVQSFTTGLITKTSALASKTVYYGKVGAELSKQVYLKEGLQPPSIGDFKKVYSSLYSTALHYAVKPKEVLSIFKGIQRNDALKFGAYGIQLLGFYSVGEVIGRRKIVGYRNYSSH